MQYYNFNKQIFNNNIKEYFSEATTSAMTEATTSAMTEATTSAMTEATTSAMTEATTSATTEATTSAMTEATTSAMTEATTSAMTKEISIPATDVFKVLYNDNYKIEYDELYLYENNIKKNKITEIRIFNEGYSYHIIDSNNFVRYTFGYIDLAFGMESNRRDITQQYIDKLAFIINKLFITEIRFNLFHSYPENLNYKNLFDALRYSHPINGVLDISGNASKVFLDGLLESISYTQSSTYKMSDTYRLYIHINNLKLINFTLLKNINLVCLSISGGSIEYNITKNILENINYDALEELEIGYEINSNDLNDITDIFKKNSNNSIRYLSLNIINIKSDALELVNYSYLTYNGSIIDSIVNFTMYEIIPYNHGITFLYNCFKLELFKNLKFLNFQFDTSSNSSENTERFNLFLIEFKNQIDKLFAYKIGSRI